MEATMQTTSKWAMPACVLAIAGAAAAALVALSMTAEAANPVTPPVFSNPTTFTNPYMPFVPGAVKVLTGRDGRTRLTVVDLYLTQTRQFTFGGETVTCRGLQETEFEDGEVAEISVNWFAQADDGSVWYFGETVDDYEDGVVTGHGGSWLVGGPGAGDPPGTMTVSTPGSFMPGNPEVGDEVVPEDLPDGSKEIGTIRKVGRTVRVPGGKFTNCVEMREFTLPDEDTESKWYAPGIGVFRVKAGSEQLTFEAATLRLAD
jgi:hypothetical protein